VPRALHQAGRLAQLVTDVWSGAQTIDTAIAAAISTRFGQRCHPELAGANVRALSRSLIAHEIQWRLQRRQGWDLFMLRNSWFQAEASAVLPELPGRVMAFAHSYSAEAVFVEAKRRGWTTVLGQIDAGPEHILIQERLAAERPEFGPSPGVPPAGYFDQWRRECALADRIVVNSEWTRESLIRAGIAAEKLSTIALPYEPSDGAAFDRAYPPAFSAQRPLRVLFVGTALVAKGVADLLLALEHLDGVPIEMNFVGDQALEVPQRFKDDPRLHWHGRVDRTAVMTHYRANDVLIFPSHSDGFGMAQVEALAWGLPIIASRNCGRVVRDGETGYLLDEVSPQAIASALRRVAAEPQTLARFSRASTHTPAPALDALATGLIGLEDV
jgi:glycosyltransferase involved in cell wall biosynthesis